MAKVLISQLKTWFSKDLKPTQSQFWSIFDSFFHKDDNIPVTQIEGLQGELDQYRLTATEIQISEVTGLEEALANAGGGGTGTPGSKWWSGSSAPVSGTGSDGDYYFRTTTGDVYTKISGAWGSPIANLKGADGSSGVLASDISVNLSGGKTFGKYASGSTIPAAGKTLEAVIRDAAMEAINPTASLSITSAQPAFNSTDITNVLSFAYTLNTPGATIATAVLQFRRNNTGAWATINNVTTASGTFTHTNAAVSDKVSSFNYQYIVTDSNGSTVTVTANVTPAVYVNPSLDGSSTDNKEIGDVAFNATRTFQKNSVNTTLTSWQILYQLNGGTITPLGSATLYSTTPNPSITISTAGTINGVSVAGLTDATLIRIYVRVVDSVGTTDILALSRTLFNPWYATTSYITTLTAQSFTALGSVVATDMVAESGSNKQMVEFPAAWGAISKLEQWNTLSNAYDTIDLASFTLTTVTETVQGISRTYKRYTNNGALIGARKLRWTV